ncbi:uncharacterized protein K452DRAFT_291414 [Aplosporella prunicola CBS 121167]|uniref:AB hydrolase-1 domain-containing protein n=1 Tax=Aplosporella prunicola CBS 121167 TaxID=1176127 RepID=A0A6A6B175_9PEZI|nr:uncharacterized protein K452DRAFT_291414 [Aplosporella prunicola CBS 121167]KAF2137596.1 hypothetical protein K452DRAFT_291414 [Aplosporella prunicola CBS 121167]
MAEPKAAPLFPASFVPFAVETAEGVTIRGLHNPSTSSSKPPLLLLHGFPQTHAIWHLVAPALAQQYTLVLADLRGYGASSKPPPSATHAAYAKSALAADCAAVMTALGHSRFSVLAHDRGARVAHKLCVDFADRVEKAILLDIVPTKACYAATDKDFARWYWHWFFLIQPAPLPETLINGMGGGKFVRMMLTGREPGTGFFAEHALSAYEEAGELEGAVHAWCEDYRAAAGVDCDEQEADEREGRKIKAPLLVLWGKKGVVEACFDAIKEWEKVSVGGVKGRALECGHYVPEAQPEELVKEVLAFLAE